MAYGGSTTRKPGRRDMTVPDRKPEVDALAPRALPLTDGYFVAGRQPNPDRRPRSHMAYGASSSNAI